MDIIAQLNYHRISPRKVRFVADAIRGLDIDEARTHLLHIPQKAARPLLKLINSAVANAENNHKLKSDYLFIKSIKVDEGPKLKRFRAKSMGMPMFIHKKVSHIQVVLDELSEEKRQLKQIKNEANKTKQAVSETQPALKKSEAKNTEKVVQKREVRKAVGTKTGAKQDFTRKKDATRHKKPQEAIRPDSKSVFHKVKRIFKRKTG